MTHLFVALAVVYPFLHAAEDPRHEQAFDGSQVRVVEHARVLQLDETPLLQTTQVRPRDVAGEDLKKE